MQKTMRYHIAEGGDQPVVRAVALVVQRESKQDCPQNDVAQSQAELTNRKSQAKTHWIRPALRKVHLASS